LKTGVVQGSVHQLEVYAALFCLEYNKDPFSIKMELRIYQNNEVVIYDADPEDIVFISLSVDKTRQAWINGLKTKEYSQPEQLKLSTYGTTWYENPFYKHYNFKGAPQLLLIDEKGNVISSGPPDPRLDGGKALIELMEKHL
jgi:hypothetical protein